MLHDQLMKHYGNLTAEAAIRDILPITKTGNLHVWGIVVFTAVLCCDVYSIRYAE